MMRSALKKRDRVELARQTIKTLLRIIHNAVLSVLNTFYIREIIMSRAQALQNEY